MSNICLKVTIEKKWCSQNFDFLNLKKLPPAQFLGSSTHADIIKFSNLLQLKNQRPGCKTVYGFSIIFLFWNIKFHRKRQCWGIVSGLLRAALLKNRLQHRYFTVIISKLFRIDIFFQEDHWAIASGEWACTGYCHLYRFLNSTKWLASIPL